MGNFTTKLLGLVTLIKTMDKHLTEGVSGISQRLEKVRIRVRVRVGVRTRVRARARARVRVFGLHHARASYVGGSRDGPH